jgi:uncharacterized membrane protein
MLATLVLASMVLGPIEFLVPFWLLLIPVCGILAYLMARRSLSGLGGVTRWVAFGFRILVIVLIAGAMAEPQWRKQSRDVSVTFILDESDSIPASLQSDGERFVEAAVRAGKKRDDRLGVVTAAREAYVQQLPSKGTQGVDRRVVGATDGTNLAAAVRLAMAVMPPDAANRIVLRTDGNQTAGNLLETAAAAKAAGIPIDVIPLTYKYDEEVLVDRLVAPATARKGENLTLRVVLQSNKAARGRLNLTVNGEQIDLDPSSPSLGTPVELKPGLNVIPVGVAALREGPQKYEAFFEPLVEGGRIVGDSVVENNRSASVTFVSGRGKVLVLSDNPSEVEKLVQALDEARLEPLVRPTADAPTSLTEMNAFDAIVLVNTPAYAFGQRQQEQLAQYVRESGGGLVVLGGPESFGAGGWMNTPIEDVLPVKLDPPQKRQMPKGALALIIHSVEIPEGVYYGKKVCEAAVGALSRLDEVGIVEYRFNGGTDWVHPLAQVGDGSAVRRSIQNLQFGDMPDFAPSLQVALAGLQKSNAGQKHCIIISDGDPQAPSRSLLQQFVQSNVSISAIGIACHGPSDQQTMRGMAQATNGRFYDIPGNKVETLPQIFIKEAQTVRRSLIWEGEPFAPRVTGVIAETFKGIRGVPALSGYVVTADREGLSMVTLRGQENDPILAQWQHGLGRVIAFTSDGTTRWCPQWVQWDNYKAFWEQHVRWAMRPSGSPNVRVTTETRGDETLIVVEALDPNGERLSFANFKGRLASPDGKGADVELNEVGPGRYEGRVTTDQSGTYVLNMLYAAPRGDGIEPLKGSVQAAITRPFADEFRTLQDNSALLEQVRAMTGGRVLNGDPALADLWSRESLTLPVASRPIWLLVTAIGLAVFLMDVAVRRVRIDILAMFGAVRRAAGKSKANEGVRADALREAREKARAGMAKRGDAGQAARTVEVAGPEETAGVKFEATTEQLRIKRTEGVAMEPGEPAEPGKKAQDPTPKSAQQDAAEGMASLLKAKKRARDEMDDRN